MRAAHGALAVAVTPFALWTCDAPGKARLSPVRVLSPPLALDGKDMATYPYISGQSAVIQAVTQLRKGFPAKVDAGYLQRFNIARANESYIISILRFLGLIDDEGNRVETSAGYFYGNDDAFKAGLEGTLRNAYRQLFDEMGDSALTAEKADLAQWFRASDKTSDLVGQRQASTFQTLASLAGYGAVPTARSTASKKPGTSLAAPTTKATPRKSAPKKEVVKLPADSGDSGKDNAQVGLTVRIEVNLPAGGDAETYDAIFASIKKHLMS